VKFVTMSQEVVEDLIEDIEVVTEDSYDWQRKKLLGILMSLRSLRDAAAEMILDNKPKVW